MFSLLLALVLGTFPHLTIDPVPQEQIVTFAYPFEKGYADGRLKAIAPNGATIDTQCNVKSTWSDGSTKHAIFALNVPRNVDSFDLVPDDRSVRPPLALKDIIKNRHYNLRVTVTIDGVNYIFNAVKTAEGPHKVSNWLRGHLVNEWMVQGPALNEQGITQPNLNFILSAKMFKDEYALLDLTVENSWHNYATNLTYDIKIANDNDITLFSERNITQYFRTRWRKQFWIDFVPPVRKINFDVKYLIGTGALPKFNLTTPLDETAIQDWLHIFDAAGNGILQIGVTTPYMPQAGGRPDIGLLPEWTCMALVSQNTPLLRASFKNDELAGAFSVHMREHRTLHVPLIDDYPTITTNPQAAVYSQDHDKIQYSDNVSSPYMADVAHLPNIVGYVPYLLTGEKYYLEEMYAWTNWLFTSQNFTYREQTIGLLSHNQIRGQSWSLRTLAETAWIAPDGVLKDYFATKLQNNIAWYNLNATDSNPLGYWGLEEFRPSDNQVSEDTHLVNTPWMHDMLVCTWKWINDMGYTESRPIGTWMAGWTLRRYSSSGYDPLDGAPFHIALQATDGHFFQWPDEVYLKTFARRIGPPGTGSNFRCTDCYPAIARAALAASNGFLLDNSGSAYNWLTNTMSLGGFSSDPRWNLVP